MQYQNYLRKYMLWIVGGIVLFIISLGVQYYNIRQTPLYFTEETSEEHLSSENTSQSEETIIYIDIKGAVNRPGLYQLSEGSRMIDAIEAAGGLTIEADDRTINLAEKLFDQQKIIVYTESEVEEQLTQGDRDNLLDRDYHLSSPSVASQKININIATVEELQTLPNIGPKKAQAIIEYRQTNGSFQSTDQIKEIKGIGEKTYEELAHLISVSP
ncbi:helix-hairpin-helix domain-containing protein [Falseniella ignava]|uniref:ComEA protein n=1 Tax=Falseniella ignava CCUG 37419 TaxID=883112 RepID=K1LNY2_9LACT|nr:helix-hairpin-helix domain-containing protein [Falseniella ignava]EKB53827.1 comEA protein [Falseniella ignava CCUG 37419]